MEQTKAGIIELPKILDPRGNLSFVENGEQIPFEIMRTYWIYDVPGGEVRGSHAFRESHEILIALSGGFDVEVESAQGTQQFTLRRSYYGLYLPPMHWRKIDEFSTNSLCLVLNSTAFNVADYIRDYAEFKSLMNE